RRKRQTEQANAPEQQQAIEIGETIAAVAIRSARWLWQEANLLVETDRFGRNARPTGNLSDGERCLARPLDTDILSVVAAVHVHNAPLSGPPCLFLPTAYTFQLLEGQGPLILK